jgi:hypothetical protein
MTKKKTNNTQDVDMKAIILELYPLNVFIIVD